MGKNIFFIVLGLFFVTACKPQIRTASVATAASSAAEIESDSDPQSIVYPDANTMITSESFERALVASTVGSEVHSVTNAVRGGQPLEYVEVYGSILPTVNSGTSSVTTSGSASSSARLVIDPEVPNCSFRMSLTTGGMVAHALTFFWGNSNTSEYMGITVGPTGAPQWNSIFPFGSPISSGSVGQLTTSTAYELEFQHSATNMKVIDHTYNTELYSVTHDGTFISSGAHDISGHTAIGFEASGILTNFHIDYFEVYGCD